jgi:hypothetical protein
MDSLGFVTLVVSGFMSCAEFESCAFVHPVVRKLPANYHIRWSRNCFGLLEELCPF